MVWRSWLFSAKLVWQRPWLRWTTILTIAMVISVTGAFLFTMIPVGRRHGTLIVHYNVYLGIDEVQPWWWACMIPAVWGALTLFDLAIAFGLYRQDRLLAIAGIVFALLWSLPWVAGIFHLFLVNGG